MSLIVQKFGGSSVQDAEHLRCVAEIIAKTYREGNEVLVVLSAQGNTTDDLIRKAREICPEGSGREMDMLLSTGEQLSVALCAMALEEQGIPCISLAAWQAGIYAAGEYQNARISKIDPTRIRKELEQHRVVLVTGFQAQNERGDLVTLGRGGSDTSAVALAAAFHAESCCIYTDVDGVYTADPRLIHDAHWLEEISYPEMLELASHGAQVLHSRSVELAQKFRVNLRVLSCLGQGPGTKIYKDAKGRAVTGLTKKVLRSKGTVTVVGEKILDSAAPAATIFRALLEQGIGLLEIHTTNRSISVTLEKADVESAVRAIHGKLFPSVL